MTAPSTVLTGLCRLSVRTPGRSFSLAVPVDVPLVDLMPAIVGFGGDELVQQGFEHGGWVLQRVGEEPLDPDMTIEVHGLVDGDVVHLRPRADALPPIHFDDLVDGVATAMRDHVRRWTADSSRRALLSAAGLAIVAGLVAIALPGTRTVRAGAALLGGLLLLGGALSAARAVGDRRAASVIGLGAVAFLALAGVLAPSGADAVGARLLAGGAAAVAASALAVAVTAWAPPFLSSALLGLLAVVGGAAVLSGATVVQAAAVVAVVGVVVDWLLPPLAFRMGGLRMPALPRNSEELQQDIDPVPAPDLLARGSMSAAYLDAMFVASGLAVAIALIPLSLSPRWPGYTLAAVVSLLAVLHSRGMSGLLGRFCALGPGALGAGLAAVRWSIDVAPATRLVVAAGLLLLAAGCAIAGWTMVGRRLLPHWGRIADLTQSLCAIALLPLTLLIFDVFHVLRGIKG